MIRSGVGGLLCLALSAGCALAGGYDDFAQGLNALNAGDDARAIVLFSSALTAGDLNPGLVPQAYLNRGRAHFARGECRDAISDFGAALKDKPEFPDATIMRGFAELCVANPASAFEDFSHTVAIDPMPQAYMGMGVSLWMQGRAQDAAVSFANAARLAPEWPAPLIWFALARQRAGLFDRGAIAEDFDRFDFSGWPRPVIDLLTGKANADEVIAAVHATDKDVLERRQCEADFYVGEWWLWQGHPERAKPWLQQTVATCKASSYEREAADSDLGELK